MSASIAQPDSARLAPAAELSTCLRFAYWHDLRPCQPEPTPAQRLTYIPPAPYNALVWRLDGEAMLTECGGKACEDALPAIFLVGAHRHALRSFASKRHCVFGLVFQPGALALLSGLDLGAQRDRIADAQTLLPSAWHSLLNPIASATDHAHRISLAQDFLRPRWAALTQREPGWSRLLAHAWRRGQLAAQGLLTRSVRDVQRHSQRLVGLRPGEIERMLRLENALLDLRNGRRRADAAHDNGFSDQPHFSREIKSLYQRTSGQMLRCLNDPERAADWMLKL